MLKEKNQIFFNFKQVEKQPHEDIQDVMYDIQMNNEGVGFMVVEREKILPKLFIGIVEYLLELAPDFTKEMIKEGKIKIQMNFDGEKFEVRSKLDENSNIIYKFQKIP